MTTNQQEKTNTSNLRRLAVQLGIALCLMLAAGAAVRALRGANSRSTDDAYIGGQIVAVVAQTGGIVSAVLADAPERVTAGQTLVELDRSDAQLAVDTATAALAQTRRQVLGLYAATAATEAQVNARRAELDRVRADQRARSGMAALGALTEEEARHADSAVQTAQAALEAAIQAHQQALAQTSATTPLDHPSVQLALTQLRTAALAMERSTVRAPVAGMVVQRSVQLGKRASAGDKLMSIVPLDRLWVDANFKEVQLDGICPGQPAQVTADVYGQRVQYHGHVADIEAGSGAAFSLLPPQNASGNWIKVVQRVPVRIRLDAGEVAAHPLRIGMSAKVEIDAGRCDANVPADPTSDRSGLYGAQQSDADRAIAAVLNGTEP